MANSVLQIIKGDDIIANVGTPEEVIAALQGAKPGRYIVEESSMAFPLQTDKIHAKAHRAHDHRHAKCMY
jgi:hypothetical protein